MNSHYSKTSLLDEWIGDLLLTEWTRCQFLEKPASAVGRQERIASGLCNDFLQLAVKLLNS